MSDSRECRDDNKIYDTPGDQSRTLRLFHDSATMSRPQCLQEVSLKYLLSKNIILFINRFQLDRNIVNL